MMEPGVRGSYWKFVSTKKGGFKVVRRLAPVPSMKLWYAYPARNTSLFVIE